MVSSDTLVSTLTFYNVTAGVLNQTEILCINADDTGIRNVEMVTLAGEKLTQEWPLSICTVLMQTSLTTISMHVHPSTSTQCVHISLHSIAHMHTHTHTHMHAHTNACTHTHRHSLSSHKFNRGGATILQLSSPHLDHTPL